MFQIIILFLFISDSFVNSQEWTLSRGVPDIRLGIVGSLSSGKSALVHRYLTGTSFASPILSKMPFSETIYFNEEKILKGSLDLIPSPSPSVETQIMGGKICLRCKGKTLLTILPKVNYPVKISNFH